MTLAQRSATSIQKSSIRPNARDSTYAPMSYSELGFTVQQIQLRFFIQTLLLNSIRVHLVPEVKCTLQKT